MGEYALMTGTGSSLIEPLDGFPLQEAATPVPAPLAHHVEDRLLPSNRRSATHSIRRLCSAYDTRSPRSELSRR
jgi:hypothetical protein